MTSYLIPCKTTTLFKKFKLIENDKFNNSNNFNLFDNNLLKINHYDSFVQ
jgi:hypothetical protein